MSLKAVKFNDKSELLMLKNDDTVQHILNVCKAIANFDINITPNQKLVLYHGQTEISDDSKIKDYLEKKGDFEIKFKTQLETISVRKVLEDFKILYVESRPECKWFLNRNEIIKTPLNCEQQCCVLTKPTDIVKIVLFGTLKEFNSVNNCRLVIKCSFENALGEVIAQAASSIGITTINSPPVFIIRTDGIKWQFGMLQCNSNGKLLLKTCYPISIGINELSLFKESLEKVYSWIFKIIKLLQ